MNMTPEELKTFPVAGKGHYYEDFEPGRVFEHHWGRTVLAAENTMFSCLMLHFNPIYFNAVRARQAGYEGMPLNPYLLFSMVFGLSVEDLSENGGAFLGIDDLSFDRAVYPDETVVARSTVVERRPSSKNPTQGIVTWRTEGFDEPGKRVVGFTRTNLVMKRDPA